MVQPEDIHGLADAQGFAFEAVKDAFYLFGILFGILFGDLWSRDVLK